VISANWKAEAIRLQSLINTPEIIDFAKAVHLEAVHQRERWGSRHDIGKTDANWFWLIGYLAGKALHNPDTSGLSEEEKLEKRLHRVITIAAAAANWHHAMMARSAGEIPSMRPGIDPTDSGEG
jgi:hypothetical protein